MNHLQHCVRSTGLIVVASLLCISPIYLSVLSLDEFASKFLLSDKVLKLHRLIIYSSAAQWLLILVLIYRVEAIKRKPSAPPNGGPATSVDNSTKARRDHAFDFRHPEGMLVDGYPVIGRYGSIEIVDENYPRRSELTVDPETAWRDGIVGER